MMLEGCQLIGFDWRYLYVNDTAARHGQRPPQTQSRLYDDGSVSGIEQTALFAVLQRLVYAGSLHCAP